jgi:HTH-type transcriptional regulator/antitoxin HigA
LRAWYQHASKASWKTPSDVRDDDRSADFVGDRVVFNIAGNHFRLVVYIAYTRGLIQVEFIGTQEDVLVLLIEAYEASHYPIEPLDPVSFLRAHMENTNRTLADLAQVLGSASRASEVLNRKRGLSLDMIRALVTAWNVPGDALLPRYPLFEVA